ADGRTVGGLLERRRERVRREATERAAQLRAPGVGRVRLCELCERRAVVQLVEEALRQGRRLHEDVCNVLARRAPELRLVRVEEFLAGRVGDVEERRGERLATGLAVDELFAVLAVERREHVGRRVQLRHALGGPLPDGGR